MHTFCMQEANALTSLHICTGLSEPSLLNNVISTKTLCAGAYLLVSNIRLISMKACGQTRVGFHQPTCNPYKPCSILDSTNGTQRSNSLR